VFPKLLGVNPTNLFNEFPFSSKFSIHRLIALVKQGLYRTLTTRIQITAGTNNRKAFSKIHVSPTDRQNIPPIKIADMYIFQGL
jgi:hypothetical protein